MVTATMPMTLSNAALAERIKALPLAASDSDSPAIHQEIQQELAALLAAVLAASPPSSVSLSAPQSQPQSLGNNGHNDNNDLDDYGLPTLLPLYLSRLLEVFPKQSRSSQLTPLAANLLLDHLGDSSLPLARRLRGAIVFISLFRAAPNFALDIFLLHAQDAFMESITDTLEPAADVPSACWSKPPVAQLVVALLDLLTLAASHASARPFITPLIPHLRVLARSSSSAKTSPWAPRGATFATNVLTKLAHDDHGSPASSVGTVNVNVNPDRNQPSSQGPAHGAGKSKDEDARSEASIHYLISAFLSDTTHARERESLMESIALLSIQPTCRPIFMSSPILGPLITLFRSPVFLSTLTPSLAFGFATLIHHLSMYPPQLSPEQRQLRRLARFAQSGGRGAPPSIATTDGGDEDTAQEYKAVTDRCTVLVKEHKVMVSLVGVYRSQSRLAQGSLSASLSATLGAIACDLTQSPTLRGLLVQQGLVGMLARIAPKDRAAAQALARCGINLNPAVAFGEQHVASVANSLWTLVVPPPMTSGLMPLQDQQQQQQQSSHDFSLAHYEALLAITNLATLPTLAPHLGDWFTRLDRSDSLVADNLDIRRAAWELLCNLVWTSPDVLEKCVDNQRRLQLVLDMAVAHAHHEEDPAMRRAVLGVLAALTCCPPVVKYLAEHVSEGSEGSETVQAGEQGGVAVSHLERLLDVSRKETEVEMVHRLSQVWVHVVEDEQVGRAWGRKMKVKQVLEGFVKRSKGHGGVVGLVGEAVKSL